MKTITIVLLLIMLFSYTAFSGQIYGSLRKEDGSVIKKMPISVTCGNHTEGTETDDNGSYSVFMQERGQCTFKVRYNDNWLSTSIYSYADPIRYDFELQRQNDGSYALQRK